MHGTVRIRPPERQVKLFHTNRQNALDRIRTWSYSLDMGDAIKAAQDVRLEDVVINVNVVTAPGPYGRRVVLLVEQAAGSWLALEGPRNIAGPKCSRQALLKNVLAGICLGDAAVPGSDANWRMQKRADAVAIAHENARWAKALASSDPDASK
jgi:hypothetical protein